MDRHGNQAGPRFVLCGVVAVLTCGLLAFSQTVAWHPDEGFHLLAAQLIRRGKRPYLDFFYQHTPLYIYLNAGWMGVFGESWRSVHALSALLTGACIGLAAGFVFGGVDEPSWRLASAISAALFVGLHFLVIRFGTIGQPYALCLLLNIVSFRLVVEAVNLPRGFVPLWGGLSAGAAAGSSLLAAPVGPILLLWMVLHNRTGNRLRKCAQFVGGVAIAFAPLLWLALQAPRQVLFDVLEYELLYRRPAGLTRGLTMHDLQVLTAGTNGVSGNGKNSTCAPGS
jgi:hypothetical protein